MNDAANIPALPEFGLRSSTIIATRTTDLTPDFSKAGKAKERGG